ncbi:MAG: hypothetical protein COB22_04205 [Cycloclasticus sp.]|nr:MAG: hypothetical protein COB22_04205 [Cycloclasticus sp.]
MEANVGGIDKTVRIVAGLAIIGWGVITQNYWGAIGLVPLGTALINWCPAYLPFGISSAKKAD